MSRTLIAIPCMDMMPVQFVQSIVNLQSPPETATGFLSGSLIYEARDQLAQIAVRENFEYVLWLDSDMEFEADLLHRLLESIEGRDFVCGCYFRRKPPFTPVVFETLEPVAMPVMEIHKDIFEVGAAGFGCVLMRTKMLKDVLEKYGTAFQPLDRMGEDISFCVRARKIGYKLHCDPSIKVGHVGYTVITEQHFKSYWKQVTQNAGQREAGT